MHFHVSVALLLCRVSWALPRPVDAIVLQIQRWGVVGAQQSGERVLLNGVLLTRSDEIDNIIKTVSTAALIPANINLNQISALKDHTILRSRECILEGAQLHWTDRVFYDGTVYLTLDHNDTWTAQVSHALALKVLWDLEVRRTKTERISLQEGCLHLMRELNLANQQSVLEIPLPRLLIPILGVVTFFGLIIVSLLVYKKQGGRHPGGVIGSIIHYPKDMVDMATETKTCGYRTL
ncbi:uncharacterized protein LOC133451957 [Cololabis saira]|uniref:uncharacterized protein LOC133451957 n=1 Tax=Cololabis saira TaxID=129043 RepID=UPI002AD23899|nr:uncharacterized protein LOC133451957 [Cololabis saira]